MKKLILFIFYVFSLSSFGQNIEGNWKFDFILPDTLQTGENLKPISNNDEMILNEDGSFDYEIKQINLEAVGNWELQGDLLSLHYSSPYDTIRFYKISVSDNSLVLNENGINYAFKKSDTKASTGFSILSVFRGLLGVISLLFIAFLFSRNRQQIDWKLVIKGLGIQFVFALLILKVPFVSKGFEFIGKIFTKIISFTQDGTMFLFSSFGSGLIETPLMNFVVMILPTVIFFLLCKRLWISNHRKVFVF